MGSKIKLYDEARVSIDNGDARLSISEAEDGVFNISICEWVSNKIRIGIPDKEGTTFIFWNTIKKVMDEYNKKGCVLKKKELKED